MSDLDRRSEKRSERRSEDSNSGPYVLIALALALAGFGASVGITSGVLVPFFVFMFPALVLLALGISKLQEKKQRFIPPKLGKERELLSAIRDNGVSITPTEPLWRPRSPCAKLIGCSRNRRAEDTSRWRAATGRCSTRFQAGATQSSRHGSRSNLTAR